MTDRRFCIDCVHYVQSGGGQFSPPVSHQCHHPSAPRGLVTGTYASCAEQRLSVTHCGPDGTRWRRKPREAPQPPPNGTWPRRRRGDHLANEAVWWKPWTW